MHWQAKALVTVSRNYEKKSYVESFKRNNRFRKSIMIIIGIDDQGLKNIYFCLGIDFVQLELVDIFCKEEFSDYIHPKL